MDALQKIIAETCSILYPDITLKKEQSDAIESIVKGENVIVNLPVGYGKSIIFHLLPRVFEKLRHDAQKVLVISPLNTIMSEQVKKLGKIAVPAIQLSQSCQLVGEFQSEDVLQEAYKSSVILTPPEGLFVAETGLNLLRSLDGKIGAIIIDECHKIDDWGKEFRRSFSELVILKSFFSNTPFACLSGTLTTKHIKSLSKQLLIDDFSIISVSPEKTNLILNVYEKATGNMYDKIENIYKDHVDRLFRERSSFPLTLMFMPMQYIAHAMLYAFHVFGGRDNVQLDNAIFGALYSNQDKEVNDCIISELQNLQPRFRLVFTTSVVGMGFDPPSVAHVIHCKPPRSITNYLQEIGRAGRRGQSAIATLYFSNVDLSKNLPGIQEDIINYCKCKTCLRDCLLDFFNFKVLENSPKGCLCCSFCAKKCQCENCQLVRVVNDLNL